MELEPELQPAPITSLTPRIVESWYSQKPRRFSLLITLSLSLFVAILTFIQWSMAPESVARLLASGESVFGHHEVWRLATSLVMHADLAHLLSNLGGFWVFGYFLYGYFGWGLFPSLSFFVGILAEALTLRSYPPEMNLLGISGMVYGMAGLWLSLFVMIERRYSLKARILRATAFVLVVLVPTQFDPKVSYLSHVWGFGLGLLGGFIWFFVFRDLFRRAERVRLEPN